MSIRIALAEDQRMIRELLLELLGRQPDFEVIAQASNGAEAIALADRLRPDVLLLAPTAT